MQKATDGMILIDGETLVELTGFLTPDGEVILSDCDSMSDWKKIKVKVEPSSIGFWIEEIEREIAELCKTYENGVNINSL